MSSNYMCDEEHHAIYFNNILVKRQLRRKFSDTLWTEIKDYLSIQDWPRWCRLSFVASDGRRLDGLEMDQYLDSLPCEYSFVGEP